MKSLKNKFLFALHAVLFIVAIILAVACMLVGGCGTILGFILLMISAIGAASSLGLTGLGMMVCGILLWIFSSWLDDKLRYAQFPYLF